MDQRYDRIPPFRWRIRPADTPSNRKMIEVSFEICGGIVKPNKVKDALQKALFQGVHDYIKQTVGPVCYPVHGVGPKIICKGPNLSDLSFEVSGCCQEFTNTVEKKLIN